MLRSEHAMDTAVGQLLRLGVIVSALIVFTGGALYVARHGSERPTYGTFAGEPSDLRTISGIVYDASRFRPRGLIQFGLLCLIATPVLRVAFSVYAFARMGDYKYIIIALIVLTLLLYSLLATA